MDRALKGADPTLIRHWNECAVVDVLRQRGPQRISNLREATGITAGPLGHVLRSLEQKRWVHSTPGEASGPGRPAQIFELNRPEGSVIGVDITPSTISAARADLTGDMTRRVTRAFDSEAGHESTCDQIADIVTELMDDSPISTVWTATVAIDADLDAEATVVAAEQFPSLIGCQPLTRMQRQLPVPLDVVSRMSSLLTVEMRDGAADGVRDFLLLDPRAAVSAGAVVDGRPVRGAHRVTGGLARAVAREDGEGCTVDRAGEDVSAAIAEDIRAWARPLAMLIGVLDPSVVVIRGAGEDQGPIILEHLDRELGALMAGVPALRISPLGAQAAADGAALLAQKRVLETMISAENGAIPFSREQFLMRATTSHS